MRRRVSSNDSPVFGSFVRSGSVAAELVGRHDRGARYRVRGSRDRNESPGGKVDSEEGKSTWIGKKQLSLSLSWEREIIFPPSRNLS